MGDFLVGQELPGLKAAYDIAATEERVALDKVIEASASLSTPAAKYALIVAERRLAAARQHKRSIYHRILGAASGWA